MIFNLLTILAFLPFVMIFFLIVTRRWPAIKAMPLTWFVTVVTVLIFWKLTPIFVAASFLKGFFVAIEIMLIIFWAVFFLEILREKGQIKNINTFFSVISSDARIQAIIIAFLFGGLIEGIAGFGVPAALTAPLLVSLGFSPFLAVIIALISNSTPVSFGAAGTPILLGLGGLGLGSELISQITKLTAIFHGIAGLVIPFSLVFLVNWYQNKKTIIKNTLEITPFILFAWASFIIPYILVAYFIGPELPAIVGSFVGILLASTAAHYGFLVPKNVVRFDAKKTKTRSKPVLSKSLKVLAPYLIIISLLTLSRTIPLLKNYLISISLSWENIFGANIGYNFLPLYTPSFYFLIAALSCIFIFKANFEEVKTVAKRTFSRVKVAALALIFTIALVQLFLVSGNNSSGISGMHLILAGFFESIFKQSFVFISPFIGAFGSFVAGSNTVSNLLFGAFQMEAARSLGISLAVILSLQVVGGAIGNLIAVHNILAASATVGLKNQEGNIIRKTIIVMLIYVTIVSILGFLAINLFY